MNAQIIIIDDNPGFLEAIKNFLEAENYSVITAGNASDGWKRIEEKKPEVLLVDWAMPGINGIDFIKKLKSDVLYREIYVIMISGKDAISDKVTGLMAGADDYITKTIPSEELLARIHAGVRISKLQHELYEQVRQNTVLEMAISIADKIGNPISASRMFHRVLKENIHSMEKSEIDQSIDDLGKVLLEAQDLLKQYLKIKHPKTMSAPMDTKMIDPSSD